MDHRMWGTSHRAGRTVCVYWVVDSSVIGFSRSLLTSQGHSESHFVTLVIVTQFFLHIKLLLISPEAKAVLSQVSNTRDYSSALLMTRSTGFKCLRVSLLLSGKKQQLTPQSGTKYFWIESFLVFSDFRCVAMRPNVGWVYVYHWNLSCFIEFGLFLPKKFASKQSFEKKNQRSQWHLKK